MRHFWPAVCCTALGFGIAVAGYAEADLPRFTKSPAAAGASISGYVLTRDTEVLTPHGIVKDIDFIPETPALTADTPVAAVPPLPVVLVPSATVVADVKPLPVPDTATPAAGVLTGLTKAMAAIEPAAGPAPAMQNPQIMSQHPVETTIEFVTPAQSRAMARIEIPVNPETHEKLFIGAPR